MHEACDAIVGNNGNINVFPKSEPNKDIGKECDVLLRVPSATDGDFLVWGKSRKDCLSRLTHVLPDANEDDAFPPTGNDDNNNADCIQVVMQWSKEPDTTEVSALIEEAKIMKELYE